MAIDTDIHWIGPKPARNFFMDHMKVGEPVPAALVDADYFNKMPLGGAERMMYPKLKELVDRAKLLKSTDLLVDISNSQDRNSYKGVQWRPDVGFFRSSKFTTAAASRTSDHPGTTPDEYFSDDGVSDAESDAETDERSDPSYVPPGEKTGTPVNNFETNLLPFELKAGNVTPFNDPSDKCTGDARKVHQFQDITEDGVDVRGQLGAVMTEICRRQHRTRTFMVFMNAQDVRFLYHDRCATIVSEAIKYRTDSQVLAEFLWRFARLTDEQQGIDKTVKAPTDEQRSAAMIALSRWAPEMERPVVVLEVPTEDGKTRDFAVWGAMAEPKSLTGRATRAYPAYDLVERKVVFLKDTWRAAVDGMEKESDILKELNAAGVRHVPKFQCGDDIPGEYHTTVTQNDIDASWRAGPLADLCKRTHHRFTEDFVGNHLDFFRTPKELLSAISDAVVAHQDAYLKCSILHRDVSGNNVLMSNEGEGILNDWDLAKRISTEIANPERWAKMSGEEQEADKAKIKGTWYFMSNYALRFPGKIVDLFDDLESFFWVTLFFTIQYLPCNKSKEQLADLIRDVFAQVTTDRHTGMHIDGWPVVREKHATDDLDERRAEEDAGFLAISHAMSTGVTATDDIAAEFQRTFTVPRPPNDIRIRDHQTFLQFFDQALALPGWPDNRKKDATVYQPPSTTVDFVVEANLKRSSDGLSNRVAKRWKFLGSDGALSAIQEIDVFRKYLEQKSSPASHILEHVQSRMVALAVNHLDTFETPRDLMKAISQALIAHEAAYLKCGFLHGDVSAMNVLIDSDANGVLNDWDLAKETPTSIPNLIQGPDETMLEGGRRSPFRNGTWYFMSNYALKFLGKVPDLYDDLESFFWVNLFFILQYLPCNKREMQLEDFMNKVFAQCTYDHDAGLYIGGQGKDSALDSTSSTSMLFVLEFTDNHPLTKWMEDVVLAFEELLLFINVSRRTALQLARSLAQRAGVDLSAATAQFRAEFTVPLPPDHIQLRNHQSFLQFFTTALDKPGWPNNRKENSVVSQPLGQPSFLYC
ncbi:hypothetical protein NLJ89_g6598 [Agrocybe chaxingu]|uniref:Fungal-type protein kinase domain-containing protein n=1 Tax=Agrocybe chaxingu TaxID=84603 RepID=A0A9W8JY05_9AGAR|nr:hypothetical protein NLJ89_g6598 [Agrocybe chaxingu]